MDVRTIGIPTAGTAVDGRVVVRGPSRTEAKAAQRRAPHTIGNDRS